MSSGFFSKCSILTVLATLLAWTSDSQSMFRNLGFEDAQIVPSDDPYKVVSSNALPHWTAAVDDVPLLRVVYDTINLGDAGVSIHDTNSDDPPISGNYMVGLQPSFPDGTHIASISQIAKVLSLHKSISVRTTSVYSILHLSFNGEGVPLCKTADPTILRGDVSKYSGQTGELKFWGNSFLDDIRFSTEPFPRPPMLTEPQVLPNGSFQFLLQGQSGQGYTVQVSTNLVSWLTLTNVPGTTNAITIVDPSAATNGPTRFYRTVSP